MGNIFKIVDNGDADFSCDLRGLADLIEEGDFGRVQSITVVVETADSVVPLSFGHKDGIRAQGLLFQAAINQGLGLD